MKWCLIMEVKILDANWENEIKINSNSPEVFEDNKQWCGNYTVIGNLSGYERNKKFN